MAVEWVKNQAAVEAAVDFAQVLLQQAVVGQPRLPLVRMH